MATEREKMRAGDLYDPLDAELVASRRRARELCRQINAMPEDETASRRSLLVSLFACGGDSVWLQPPVPLRPRGAHPPRVAGLRRLLDRRRRADSPTAERFQMGDIAAGPLFDGDRGRDAIGIAGLDVSIARGPSLAVA